MGQSGQLPLPIIHPGLIFIISPHIKQVLCLPSRYSTPPCTSTGTKLDPRHGGERVIVTFIPLFISMKPAAMMRSDRRAGDPQSSLKTAPGGSNERSGYQSSRLTGRVGNDRPSHKQRVGRQRSVVRECEAVFGSHYSGSGGWWG